MYLRSDIIIGESITPGGPQGLMSAPLLSASLEEIGFPLRRFKTGTPARIDVRSIDFDEMTPQPGDEPVVPFSFLTERKLVNTHQCYLTWTTHQTHDIIRANLHRAPLYSGKIHGVGPRYCPSIEDKVVRFADKERHLLFVEPMGLDTQELYIQGYACRCCGMQGSLPHTVHCMHIGPILKQALDEPLGLAGCSIVQRGLIHVIARIDILDRVCKGHNALPVFLLIASQMQRRFSLKIRRIDVGSMYLQVIRQISPVFQQRQMQGSIPIPVRQKTPVCHAAQTTHALQAAAFDGVVQRRALVAVRQIDICSGSQ